MQRPPTFILLSIFYLFCHALVWAGTFSIGSADGSFEAGLMGTTASGDVRLHARLGSLRPSQGQQAVVLTTAPDAGAERLHAHTSVLRFDPMTIPDATPQLRLDYVFLTNERTPSYTNDRFAVTLVLIAGGEATLLHVDTFDPQYPAPWTGYARQTGFRTLQADLSAYAGTGETVSLELRLHDVGDGRGDSAVFVDNVQLTALGEPLACVHSVYQALQPGDTLFADGSCSTDSDDLIVEYRWNLDDGRERIGRFIEHTYTTEGIYQVTLTVKDATGNTSTSAFHVVVGDANHAPQIVSAPVVLAANDTPYRYDVLADDPEMAFGDVLTFALTEAPAGMSINPATGTISWTPNASDTRQNPVTVTVTDSLGRSDLQVFTLIVDAAVDIVASDDLGRLYAARSNGDGTFADYRLIDDIGRNTRGVALADFDRDGDVDLLAGSAQGNTLTLFYLEKQSGHFAAPIPIASLGDSDTPAGDFLLDMAAADFNNDGNPDAILNSNGPHSWVLLNQGQRTFDISLLSGTSGNGRGLDTADIDGDGHLDIARGRCCDGLVELYLGNGTGQFSPIAALDVGSDPYGVVLADINTDGIIDLLTQSTNATALFFQGNGDGTFRPGVSVPSIDTHNDAAFAAVDLNQDGAADLVAVDYTFKHVWFYPGNGDATFGPRSLIGVTSGNTLGIAAPAGRVIGQPVSLIVVDADTVNTGGSVAFDASSSYDDGSIIAYHWDFGDGSMASGATASHLYRSEGIYQVVLTITDDDGHVDRRSQRIAVNGAPPIADAGGPYVLSEADANHGKWAVALDGSASSDAESDIRSYTWDVDASDGIGIDATGPATRHTYTAPGIYTVTLTVTDGADQSTSDTTSVTVMAGAPPVATLSAPAVLDESAASFGSWGMRADVSGSADDLAIASYTIDWGDNTQTTISALRDTFADGDLDDNPVWTSNGGTWTVIDGQLHQSDTSSGWKWLQALSASYRDFILQLDVQGVSSGGQIGIVFHNANLSGGSDTFLLSSADGDNSWRFTDGSGNMVLAESGSGWDPGIWYHLRLVVSGATMQLFVTPQGGSETLQLEAAAPSHPSGGIGLLANAQHVIFDNIEVTPSGDSLQPMHRYSTTGDYTIALTVADHAAQSASASVTTRVIAGATPIANAGGPYVLTEADASGGAWVFSPDASASSDDYGIFDYQWDFGDGSSGSGVNPTHVYSDPGTYTVTLTVTDHAGQPHSTTATVDVSAGSPPVADAGGPYLFGETAASLGVWTANFDASGSSDDVGIDTYEWWLSASDAFTGSAIDANTWLASPGVTQDDAISVTGIGTWGQRYLFSAALHHRIFQAQVRPLNTTGFQFGMWGLRRADASDFSYTSMPYAIYFHGNDIQVYEDGAARGSFAPYTRGDLYDIRITVKGDGAGAVYEFKRAADADWTLLYDSEHPSNVPLQVGGTVVSGTFVIDNVQRTQVYSGPALSQSFTTPGVHALNLKVWDRAGQPASDSTTVTIAAGTPPLADAGGPYILLHDRLVAFSSADSSDDAGIMRYHWDFGDGSATTNPNPVHLYATPDTYTVTLTVTDHALQSSSATTTVQPGQVSQVDTTGLSGDWQTLEIGGTLTAQIDNLDTEDMGPFTVIFFEDVDGDGRFDAALDTTLGSAAYAGLAAAGSLPVSAVASGMVRFRQPVISAFLDSGAASDASDVAHYGDSRQACTQVPQIGQFNPVLEWQWSGDPVAPASDGVIMAPAVIDLTADGIPDVVFASVAGVQFAAGLLRAINGADGSPIFTVTDPGVYGIGQLAVGDIDRDGRPEIVAVDGTGSGLVAFEHDGAVKWQSPPLPQPVNWGGPTIADLDHDGTPEIVVGASVVNADGSLRWSGTLGRGEHPNGLGPLSLVADLNLQGGAEVVAGNTAYYADGSVYWHNTSLGDGFNAVGNFDLDAFPEIVLVSDGKVYLLEHDGALVWGPAVLPGGGEGGAPTVADVDGDGEPEIGVATGGAYTVLETDGTLKWSQPIQDASSRVTGASVFDFEGDGRAEIVYGDETTLRIFRGSDGTVLWATPSLSSTGYELPLIVDVDGDGQAEILKVSDDATQGAGIQVFGDADQSWVGSRQLWNQHTYHLTNINDDGSIPQHEAPSWQTHNSYRRNLLTVGDPLRFADLTASFVRLVVQDGVAQVTARIGNGGAFAVPAGVAVAFYDGDPDSGGTLLGAVATTTALAPNAFEDVSLAVGVETVDPLWVVVDGDDTVAECDAANNRHNSGLLVQFNQPPIAAAGGPYTVQEGVALSLDGSGSSDADGDALTYAWDLDGDGMFEDASGAAPTVTFPDNGSYPIALQVSDGNEAHTDTAVVTVSNAAPVVLAGPDQRIVEGASINLAPATYTDAGLMDTHSAAINWGDGIVETGMLTAASSSGTVHGTHLYDDNGAFTVIICVTDNDAATGCGTLEVNVGNSPPAVALDATDAVALRPGGFSFFVRRVSVSQTYSAAGSDAGSDDLTFTWHWGDGGVLSQNTHFNDNISADGRPPSNRGAIAPFNAIDSASHTYTAPGAYALSVHLSDDDLADSGQSPTTATLPTLVTDAQDCSMTMGFWQHQFDPATKKPQVSAAARQAYLSLISRASDIFSERFPAATSAAAWLILQPDDTNATTIQGQAIEQALAAWLNFARGAVEWNATIPRLSRPFDQVMAEIESVFLTANPIAADYVRANDLAVAINEMDAKNKDCKQR